MHIGTSSVYDGPNPAAALKKLALAQKTKLLHGIGFTVSARNVNFNLYAMPSLLGFSLESKQGVKWRLNYKQEEATRNTFSVTAKKKSNSLSLNLVLDVTLAKCS